MDKNETRIIIYADNQEVGSKVVDILEHKCELRTKRLPVADYLLSKRVAVERKTTSDFLSSLVDGRLFRQLNELKENFHLPLIIIEGNSLFVNERKIHPNAIRGAIASISLDYGIPIIRTENPLDTAEMLVTIAKREQIDRNKTVAIRGRKKSKSINHYQEYLLAGLPNINTKTAKKLLKHFGTPERIFTAKEEELRQIDGIGPKLAKRIRLVLAKKYEKSILED